MIVTVRIREKKRLINKVKLKINFFDMTFITKFMIKIMAKKRPLIFYLLRVFYYLN